MSKTAISIAIGLGDNIMIRGYLDTIKHQYSEIRISHHSPILAVYRDSDVHYHRFMNELGPLLFSEPPYVFDHGAHKHMSQPDVLRTYNIQVAKPNLSHLLCKGESLKLNKPYIVLTTKVRMLNKHIFYPLSVELWGIIRKLSEKYTIVVMGEREVEKSKEYVNNLIEVYSLYEQIISNIPNERILDITVPALGITAPSMTKLQQDCLIMKEAAFVLAIGVGGNYCTSLAVANTICFRAEADPAVDTLASRNYNDVFITRDFGNLKRKLMEYA